MTVDDAGRPTGTIGVAFDVTEREERAANLVRRVAEERAVVEVVQHAVLPKVLPTVPGVQLAARYVAAPGNIAIGGDWYASVPLADGRLGIAIGDVAGHGIDAVAEMAHARFSLRALAGLGGDASEVLGRLGMLVRTFSPGTMITALYGILDPTTGRFECAVAGQCPPVVRDPRGHARLLTLRPGPPLGFDVGYVAEEARFEPGSSLVLYTDGLVERRGEHLDRGFERLLGATASGPDAPELLCEHLLATMHTGVHCDDTAVLVVQFDDLSAPPHSA
ncbi:MAG: PP2C family protein-serine/threonine phosphatase [Acidimicrobiia bacterium]